MLKLRARVKNTPHVGRTHGIHAAQLIWIDFRFWHDEMRLNREV